jgi:hypothetical protein
MNNICFIGLIHGVSVCVVKENIFWQNVVKFSKVHSLQTFSNFANLNFLDFSIIDNLLLYYIQREQNILTCVCIFQNSMLESIN